LVNYCVGATAVPLRTFGWTTAIGILPGSMVFAFVGSRIPTLAEIVETGVWQLLDPMLFAILAAAFAFPIIIRWAIRRYQLHAGADPTLELTELEASNSWSVTRQANGVD